MRRVYVGFNDAHLTEKLTEEHRLPVNRQSVRRIRRALGRPPSARGAHPAPGAGVHRTPLGAAWCRSTAVPLPGSARRTPPLMLFGAVDDATTEILALHFRSAEDLHGYATLFHQLFTTQGLPL